MRALISSLLAATLLVGGLLAPAGATEAEDDRYFVAAETGGDVLTLGDAPFLGSLADTNHADAIVDLAGVPGADGYWLTSDDGGVYAFGDATFRGSMAGTPLNQPIVAMAATPTGEGYWLAARDGGVFAFGDATFAGSMGGTALNSPMASMTPTDTGAWYTGALGVAWGEDGQSDEFVFGLSEVAAGVL